MAHDQASRAPHHKVMGGVVRRRWNGRDVGRGDAAKARARPDDQGDPGSGDSGAGEWIYSKAVPVTGALSPPTAGSPDQYRVRIPLGTPNKKRGTTCPVHGFAPIYLKYCSKHCRDQSDYDAESNAREHSAGIWSAHRRIRKNCVTARLCRPIAYRNLVMASTQGTTGTAGLHVPAVPCASA